MKKVENILYHVLYCFLHRKKIEINGVLYQVKTCSPSNESCDLCDFPNESNSERVIKDICDICIDAEGYAKCLTEFHYLKKTDKKEGKIFKYEGV